METKIMNQKLLLYKFLTLNLIKLSSVFRVVHKFVDVSQISVLRYFKFFKQSTSQSNYFCELSAFFGL